MKILYSTIIFTTITVCLLGCKKYLDTVPDDILTLEQAFTSRATAEKYLANIYSAIPHERSQRFPADRNSGVWTGASDEAEYLWGFVPTNSMNIGSWDVNSPFTKIYWQKYYTAIRSASYFINHIDSVKIDISQEQKKQYKAEARTLRAIYYFWLIRIYGPVMILGDYTMGAEEPSAAFQVPRNSLDECVGYISNELDIAAADLPVQPVNDANRARMTRPIALAYKAQALLFAASPLVNGNADYATLKNKDGKQLIAQTFDVGKYERAAKAYQQFIQTFVPSTFELYKTYNTDGSYNPYLSLRDVVLTDWNKETIFGRPDDDNNRNYDITPYHNGYSSEVRGSGGLGATQKIVDAFFMSNGKAITDPTSGYKSGEVWNFQAPGDNQNREVYSEWAFREPRFYVNITYDNSKWLNVNSGEVITRLYFMSNSGKGTSNDYCPTGYVVRKGATTRDWHQGGGVIVMYRLANLFLDYVEALNEYDPSNPEILKYLNLVRERAGIAQYGMGVDVPQGQVAMRNAIRQERQVELCFENVRFFDTRRWKIAEQTDSGPMYGLDIDSPVPAFYNKKPFENRVFNKKHYFFPIPFEDANINKQLVQNPGW